METVAKWVLVRRDGRVSAEFEVTGTKAFARKKSGERANVAPLANHLRQRPRQSRPALRDRFLEN